MTKSYYINTVILALLTLCLSSCDATFNPWQENDQYFFSIYGYLDAAADTQWVRVMPVREDFYLESKPSEATVTLEHLQTGNTVVLNDSLVSFAHGVYAYNFWTTMDLQSEQTYLITATRPDGKFSSVQVTLPKDFPTPVVRDNPLLERLEIVINGVEKLVDTRTLHYVRFAYTDIETMVSIIHLQDTLRLASGDFMIPIDKAEIDDKLEQELGSKETWSIIDQQIFIASAGPGHHHFPSIDEKIVALPDGISNVSNGVGYLTGIISITIPHHACTGERPNVYIPCAPEPYPW